MESKAVCGVTEGMGVGKAAQGAAICIGKREEGQGRSPTSASLHVRVGQSKRGQRNLRGKPKVEKGSQVRVLRPERDLYQGTRKLYLINGLHFKVILYRNLKKTFIKPMQGP